jgi:hypothetical protein
MPAHLKFQDALQKSVRSARTQPAATRGAEDLPQESQEQPAPLAAVLQASVPREAPHSPARALPPWVQSESARLAQPVPLVAQEPPLQARSAPSPARPGIAFPKIPPRLP